MVEHGVLTTKTFFQSLGWVVRLQQKRHQYFLTLAKEIALGSGLKKGDQLFYYLVECNKKKALLIFLDGDQRPKEEMIKLQGISFLVKE